MRSLWPRVAVGLVLATPGLAGCGDDNPDDIASYPEKSSVAPDCGDVWVAGETLPADYDGCNAEDGSFNARIEAGENCVLTSIVDGSTVFFAEVGGTIGKAPTSTLVEDEAYSRALEQCL